MVMHGHFIVNIVLAWMIVFGFKYRFATLALFHHAYCVVFNGESSRTSIILYLYSLLALLLFFVPANRAFSIDAQT